MMEGPIFKIFIPCKIVSVANKSEHWTQKYRRQKTQKRQIYYFLINYVKIFPKNVPNKIKFCRYGLRLLDSDNLIIAFKHIRDQVASLFCVKDSPTDPISWEYSQEKSKNYEFSIEIFW